MDDFIRTSPAPRHLDGRPGWRARAAPPPDLGVPRYHVDTTASWDLALVLDWAGRHLAPGE
jgi:hypothetical protein